MVDVVKDAARSGWGEPIASVSFSASPNIDVANLGGYRELLIVATGLLFGGASDAPGLRFSLDNGSTFLATGYECGSTTTTNFDLSTAVTGEHAFVMQVMNFCHATRKPRVWGEAARVGAAINSRYGQRAAGLYNAIRVYAGGANNFSAGVVDVFGRF